MSSYPTVAYPEWRSIVPKIHEADVPEFVETASRAAEDVFGQYHDLHKPERDSVSFLKRKAVYAALALAEHAEDGSVTLADAAEVMGERAAETVEEREIADVMFDAQDLALIAYARQCWRREWGAEKSSFDSEYESIIVGDGLHELEEAGRDIWTEDYEA